MRFRVERIYADTITGRGYLVWPKQSHGRMLCRYTGGSAQDSAGRRKVLAIGKGSLLQDFSFCKYGGGRSCAGTAVLELAAVEEAAGKKDAEN